jgi:hypothetical protein
MSASFGWLMRWRPLEESPGVMAAFKRQSDVPGRWCDKLPGLRVEIVTGPAPLVDGAS